MGTSGAKGEMNVGSHAGTHVTDLERNVLLLLVERRQNVGRKREGIHEKNIERKIRYKPWPSKAFARNKRLSSNNTKMILPLP